jgi:hypothetical protein
MVGGEGVQVAPSYALAHHFSSAKIAKSLPYGGGLRDTLWNIYIPQETWPGFLSSVFF